ncbi:MAG: hydroxymethylbilane synthase [Verrucomicrobia bacterium]|nr:hydroxymethylbilane synthase [Verrucomicrobiota bacterium]
MNAASQPIVIATRGSALALVQADHVLALCRAAFPAETFEIRTFKTTGDNLLGASLTESGKSLPKGLFTKELETALLAGEADLAVHSLKDLPTELPDGLALAAVSEREDVRDVLISSAVRSNSGANAIKSLPPGATVGTSSTRRRMQLLALRPDLRIVEIRGNVLTRLRKVSEQADLHATILAAAGLKRLGYRVTDDGKLEGKDVPAGLRAAFLSLDAMLPAPGQAALGIETCANDARLAPLCAKLNHAETFAAVTAEREFLRAMGGGCLAPIAAHAVVADGRVSLRAVWFPDSTARRTEGSAPIAEAAALGQRLASELKAK